MAGLKVKIGADASQFERTMRGVKREVGGVKKSILGIGGAVGAVWAVNKAFDAMRVAAKGAFEFIKSSSQEAASVENITMQFETLLGSQQKAKGRMKEIVNFAKTTPFEIKGLAETSSMLQGMTNGALARGAGLRMVGDAAAAVNKPLEVVGENIGRIYQGLTEGGEVAEAAQQLMKYGLVTGRAKVALQDFVKEAKAGKREFLNEAEALDVLNKMFGKTEGAMARLAETTDGKKSMVKDAMDQIKVAFGTGFNDGLKDALDAATEFIPQFQEKMEIAGSTIGTAITEAVQGDETKLKAVGQYIGSFIAEGIERLVTAAIRESFKLASGSGLLEAAGVVDDGTFGLISSDREVAGKWKKTRGGLSGALSASTGNAVDNLQTREIRGQLWRYQAPDAPIQSPFTDAMGRRMVMIAESIDRKLTPQPGT